MSCEKSNNSSNNCSNNSSSCKPCQPMNTCNSYCYSQCYRPIVPSRSMSCYGYTDDDQCCDPDVRSKKNKTIGCVLGQIKDDIAPKPTSTPAKCTTSYALRTMDESTNTKFQTCPICYTDHTTSNTFTGTNCNHLYDDSICKSCAITYVKSLMGNGKIEFKCLSKGCKGSFGIGDLKAILTWNDVERLQDMIEMQ